MDTIFALSSGAPPAGIAVIRVSGPDARAALAALAAPVPEPSKLQFAAVRDAEGSVLDHGFVAFLPGPGTATGEDIAELHLHGGRAVVVAVETALAALPGLRRAEPGEFTRRAFANGRIDLAEAEGLADLLSAETELQRRAALEMASGRFSHRVEAWRGALLSLSAQVEAVLDFDDESDVSLSETFQSEINVMTDAIGESLAWPAAETLRDGFRIALAGPPNAGKSTLFNALVEHEAAITSPAAGTTRDVLERPVAIDGVPLTFVDMAGLREAQGIEAIGVERARAELERADLALWLGPEGEGPAGAWEIEPQVDRVGRPTKSAARFRVSAVTGEGLPELKRALVEHARLAMPRPGMAAINARQRRWLTAAHGALGEAASLVDPLLIAEQLRVARQAFDALVGRTATEDMLDALFGRFCIGK